MIYWFTGQPGHGKTTLALALIEHLRAQGTEPFHVDGDDLRALTANADYSRAGREANIRRAQTIALSTNPRAHRGGVIGSTVPRHREELKTHADVTEVYVHTTEQRGREEKHAKDYEPPLENFIEIDTTAISIEEGLNMLLQHLEKPF